MVLRRRRCRPESGNTGTELVIVIVVVVVALVAACFQIYPGLSQGMSGWGQSYAGAYGDGQTPVSNSSGQSGQSSGSSSTGSG